MLLILMASRKGKNSKKVTVHLVDQLSYNTSRQQYLRVPFLYNLPLHPSMHS